MDSVFEEELWGGSLESMNGDDECRGYMERIHGEDTWRGYMEMVIGEYM